MKESDKRLLKLSELRTAQNKLLAAGITDENREEMRNRDTEIENLETEYRAALRAEEAETRAGATLPPADDSATREMRALIQRSNVGNIVREVIEGTRLMAGPESELRAEIFGENSHGLIPWELLDPEPETRAITPVAESAQSDSYRAPLLERIFTRSVAARLGVNMPSVSPGKAVFPIFNQSGGPAAGNVAADAAGRCNGRVVLRGNALPGSAHGPIRIPGRGRGRVPGTGVGLPAGLDGRDVRRNGQPDRERHRRGSASERLSFGASRSDRSRRRRHLRFRHRFVGKPDRRDHGLHGNRRRGSRGAAHVPEIRRYVPEQRQRQLARPVPEPDNGGVAATSRIPDPASNVQKAIAVRTAYPGANAQAPIWQGLRVIRDEISNAAKGQIALTAIMLWNFKIVREDAFAILEFKLA